MGTQKDSTSKQSTSLSGTQEKQKGKINTLDRYIIFCLAFSVGFVILEEVRLWVTNGQEAAELARGVFTMVTGELFGAIILYRFKIKRRKSDE